MSQVKPIPDGFHSITPHLVIDGAQKAIEFYKKAFGAEEVGVLAAPDGRVMHAEMKIGNSIIMLADEFPEHGCPPRNPKKLGATPVTLHTYVTNCDASVQRAVGAGAVVVMPPTDMFWGDRYAQIADPFGHVWSLATHQKDMTFDEIRQAAASMMGGKK